MVDEKEVFFRLVDEKKRLEVERTRLVDEYNRAVFEDDSQLERIDKVLQENAIESKRIDSAIRGIRNRTDIEVITEWRKEYSNN